MSTDVAIESGLIRGLPGPVRRFLGIPYAKPPVGSLRWRPPEAVEPWVGVRDATRFAKDPFQQHDTQLRGDGLAEDCLYLNVWTPSCEAGAKLPVLVWIHGNGYTRGSGSHAVYDGYALARRGAVVVTINYRLGLAGFLAHPGLTAESPQGSSGNYGLLDQIAALQWVRDNVAQFGGDPSRVTVFGQSAGATCAQLLMASPLASGLFSQAILHSPGSMRPMSSLADAEAGGLRVGRSVDQLRSLSISELWPKASTLIPAVRSLAAPRGLGPIVDGWAVRGDDVSNYREGRIAPIPLLVGTTANEGRRLRERMAIKTAAEVLDYQARSFGGASAVPRAYALAGDDTAVAALDRVLGDTQFNYGAWSSAREMERIGGSVFRYRFDKAIHGCDLPPTHDDELPYVFGTLHAGNLWRGAIEPSSIKEADLRLSRVMGDAWVQFAKTGSPATLDLPGWLPSLESPAMVFDGTSSLRELPTPEGLRDLEKYFGHCEPVSTQETL